MPENMLPQISNPNIFSFGFDKHLNRIISFPKTIGYDVLDMTEASNLRFGSLIAGSGERVFQFNPDRGLSLGNEKFDNAALRIDMQGRIYAKRLTLENFLGCEDSTIVYTGTWALHNVGVLYGGKRKLSNTVGDYFTISFLGTSIGLILEKASNQGKLKISVDGTLLETIDLYSTTLFSRSVVWQKTDLINTLHTLKGEVETKNASASDNKAGLQGYTLFPHAGIKMEQLSCDLYAYGITLTTDANGYVATTISVPTGHTVYHIVGMRLDEAKMSDAGTDDPKLCWRTTELYMYNGLASTAYVGIVTLLLSKL